MTANFKVNEMTKVNIKPRVIGLFSGCGGFSCGFEQSGFVTELAIDIHKPSIETIKRNHKNTSTICGDIRKIDPRDCRKLVTTENSNIVITGSGRYVEVQGSGEENTFSGSQLQEILRLAQKGARELTILQKKATRDK